MVDVEVRETYGTLLVAAVTGEVDHATADGMRADLAALVEQGARHLVLDMSAVQFLDSSGITALLTVWRRVEPMGGSVSLVAVPARVQRVVRMTGVAEVLPMYAGAAEAVADQGGGPVG